MTPASPTSSIPGRCEPLITIPLNILWTSIVPTIPGLARALLTHGLEVSNIKNLENSSMLFNIYVEAS